MTAISPPAIIPLFSLIDGSIAASSERAYVGNHLIAVQIRHRNVWDIWMGS